MPRPQSNVSPSATIQQPSVVNQSKHTNNTWKDPWDWNLDQQSDTQQQQQQHYIPTYSNQGQLISNSIQDHYYKNDVSDVLNQNSMSGRNTPRTEDSRQAGQPYTDSFSSYTNYNQNQQYPLPSRQMGAKSTGYEHSQRADEQQQQQQQPQNMTAYAQQRFAPPQSQKEPQPTSAAHPSSSSATSHNYNWNKDDSANPASQHNWQNYTDMLDHWQDPPKESTPVDNANNKCAQSPPPQMYNVPVDKVNKEHSTNQSNRQQGANEAGMNRSNAASSQLHNQNREIAIAAHQPAHLVQTNNMDEPFNFWQADWRSAQNDVHPNQWLQQVTDKNSFNENMSQNNTTAARFTVNDWQMSSQQQVHAPTTFHYVPTISTTVDNTIHTPNNNEQQATLSTSTASRIDELTIQARPSDVKSPISEHHNLNAVADENASKSDALSSKNVFVVSENDDHVSPSMTTDELSSSLGQLNIGGKSNKHTDHSVESLDVHSTSMEGRGAQHTATNFNVTNIRNSSVPDNMSVLPPDYAASSAENTHSIDSPLPIVAQEHLIPNTYQSGATKVTDSVSQSGYDQWYNQNTLPTSLENTWYAKDHVRPPKQWNAEQNVENYENIQQTSDFVNVEVLAPTTTLQERDIYGSRDSINKETLDNDPKPSASPKEATNTRDFREEASNVEVPSVQQQRPHPPLQPEQMPDNYEFASNDRNTFLETGELTDSHQEHEPTPPSQDDENDEVPNDIPFLREVPGQSSTIDPRRNDPTGQEQYVQTGQRLSDPRRNDPSGQEQSVRNIADRVERRDVPPGQERNAPLLLRGDADTLERRNDPSGRERSLPPQQSRNDPSGEERYQLQSSQIMLEPSETREVPGRGNESEEAAQQTDAELRQIPGGASPNDVAQLPDDRTAGRVVTGSQEVVPSAMQQDQTNDSTRNKREEAVGESQSERVPGASLNRRDSYEDEDDEGSGNSREDSRERRREASPDRRRYEYDRKNAYYERDRDREYEDDYYYDRRRAGDNDRQYNTRDDFERRDVSYRDDDRKHHSRDDLDRHGREDMDRRGRAKEDLDERDSRRRPDDRRRDRGDDPRRRDPRDYDPRFLRDPRDRDYMDRERRRDDRRSRRYDDYDMRDPYRRDYYDDPYGRRYALFFFVILFL